jgi:ParB family chromosome partitioning protein
VGSYLNMVNIQSIDISELSTEFSHMRLIKPELIKSMEQSLSRFHQLNPIIVREANGQYQIIDGFKRYHAASNLDWCGLSATVIQTTVKAATAMMITYNKNNNSLNDYEEAMILLSLKQTHNMHQDDIAQLVGFSVSWVSRRLALVEKLETSVKDELKLGVITSTQARDISKLPRGNQIELTKCVVDYGLTSRQTTIVIGEFLKHKNRDKQKYIIDHPLEILENSKTRVDDDYDSRLSVSGNKLLKSIKSTYRQMNYLNNYLRGGLGTKLTLLDWSILENELKSTSHMSTELITTINKTPNNTR